MGWCAGHCVCWDFWEVTFHSFLLSRSPEHSVTTQVLRIKPMLLKAGMQDERKEVGEVVP